MVDLNKRKEEEERKYNDLIVAQGKIQRELNEINKAILEVVSRLKLYDELIKEEQKDI